MAAAFQISEHASNLAAYINACAHTNDPFDFTRLFFAGRVENAREILRSIYQGVLGNLYPQQDAAVEPRHPSLLIFDFFLAQFNGDPSPRRSSAQDQAGRVADHFGVRVGHPHRDALMTSLKYTIRAAILSLTLDQQRRVRRAFGCRHPLERDLLFCRIDLCDKQAMWVTLRESRRAHDRVTQEDELVEHMREWQRTSLCAGDVKCWVQRVVATIGFLIAAGAVVRGSVQLTNLVSFLILVISCFAQWKTGRFRIWRDRICRCCCVQIPQRGRSCLRLQKCPLRVYVARFLSYQN